MIIVEFFGGPGSGKTTLASSAFSYYKRQAKSVEFTREYAQELIYEGREHLLPYQFVVAAGQYRKYKELELSGANIVFSDTSLSLSKIYARPGRIKKHLIPLLDEAEKEFEIIKVFVQRKKPFDTQGRVHSEEESQQLDLEIIEKLQPFNFVVTGDEAGFTELIRGLTPLLLGG